MDSRMECLMSALAVTASASGPDGDAEMDLNMTAALLSVLCSDQCASFLGELGEEAGLPVPGDVICIADGQGKFCILNLAESELTPEDEQMGPEEDERCCNCEQNSCNGHGTCKATPPPDGCKDYECDDFCYGNGGLPEQEQEMGPDNDGDGEVMMAVPSAAQLELICGDCSALLALLVPPLPPSPPPEARCCDCSRRTCADNGSCEATAAANCEDTECNAFCHGGAPDMGQPQYDAAYWQYWGPSYYQSYAPDEEQ